MQHGFDWLVYQFNAHELSSVALLALANHHLKIQQLFEQARSHQPRLTPSKHDQRVDYINRWQQWVFAGVDEPLFSLSTKEWVQQLGGTKNYTNPWVVNIVPGIVIL